MIPLDTAFFFFVFVGGLSMLVWLSRGPFFVPTRNKHVVYIVDYLAIKPAEKFADLGSGDGRLILAIGEAGGEAHGYEHNPFLVARSRSRIKKQGLEKSVHVHMNDFWGVDTSVFDGVVIYGIPYIMGRLEKKLQKELKPGARVVSYSFPFPTWEPTERNKQIFLYKK